MRKAKEGERVGAILGSDAGKLRFLGFGVYEGDFVPDESAVGFFAEAAREVGLPNPRIRLDSGKVVWGCECWWGVEDGVQRQLDQAAKAGATIVLEDIDSVRASFQKASGA